MTWLHRRLRRAVRDRESGASSVELVLYAPLLMLITFLLVQCALSWYGDSVAGAAAREAARIARVGGGTPAALASAENRGESYARAVGGQGLRDVTVTVVRIPGDQVRATVSGRSMELVVGFAPRVSATVEGPIEQFRPDL
ncbi:TadE/TadG family type IV pilus assembly protein [Cellulomonas rhizosphaerae]|uniref:Pilus assembly protein n=1 Tax=Cellulomonas rhizosphaerae TaxID=2293719 RepID=A0A413RPI7_9CELL|nr:TadE/TadG family type IV pilus assembly protein [Cellulomonas rhizosphaerae]RHA43828.1 pilus assembly protein [Cellulomonas rhizosphaerae]